MGYRVKEIFGTLQGEGAHTGRSAVFCRFTGCNLWTGREANRPNAVCQFCDTDFVGTDGPGGGAFATADDLASAVATEWARRVGRPPDDFANDGADRALVVCTGGEPLLQLDGPLIDALHDRGFEVSIETNGTIPVPDGIDWVCVSPKVGAELVVTSGHELKLVFPQSGPEPEWYEALEFDRFSLQPMDGPDLASNAAAAVEYCITHPRWRLSLQTHKYLGIP